MAEPDTLFLLDPSAEDERSEDNGGLLTPDGSAPWQPSSEVVEVPGKYRTGLQSVQPNYGYLWMPMAGLLPTDQFTIEMWLKGTVPWSQISNNRPFALVTDGVQGIVVTVNAGHLWVRFAHNQAPTEDNYVANLNYDASSIPANQWVNVAFTYAAGALRLYINGQPVNTVLNVPPPQVWSDWARDTGISIAGAWNSGATQMAISDLRISRFARTPGQTITVTNANDMIVDPSSVTGTSVNQNLLGGLHGITEVGPVQPEGPTTEAMAQGILHVIRTDKMLSATPIKAGAPDATHPSAGISGAYSYDWQVVDRTFAYLARLGVTPYVSIDSAPQILGGSIPPLSGLNLTSNLSYESAFAPQVPNDMTAWYDIVRDFVYHVTMQKGYNVAYWGVWNEPDGSNSWDGTLTDYLNLYKTTAAAVKSVNPGFVVGGPETAAWDKPWVQSLVNLAGTLPRPAVTASGQAGGYSGTRKFDGSTTWYYRVVARNGSGNSLGSAEVSATPELGGSVVITPTLPPGTTTWDIYASPLPGGEAGAMALLASGISADTPSFTDRGIALSPGSLPNTATASGIPLDFVSWHYYSGNLGEIPQASAEVHQWAQAAGIPTPRLVVGEWAWQLANTLGKTAPGPWQTTNYFLNDWAAAFAAESLMEMQSDGISTAIYTFPVADATGTGLMSPTAPWANLNVFRMWSMLQPQIVQSTYTGQPGVMAQASTGTDGRITVLIAYLRYRKDVDAPVTIHFPQSYAGDTVQEYVIDDQHSDAYDAGAAHANLEQIFAVPVASDGSVQVLLRPRSVHLIVISPTS